MKGMGRVGAVIFGMALLLSACTLSPGVETPLPVPSPAPVESPGTSPDWWEMGAVRTGYIGENGWEDRRRLEPGELEELFTEWGFSEDESFYQHRTPEGELDLTLYLDEEGERGIGFWGDLEEGIGRRDGFAFEGFSSPEGWGDWYGWRDPYDLPEVERNDVILDCWEEWEYNNYGRRAEGRVYVKVDDPRFNDPDRVPLYEASYTYDEETRTLEHRGLWHNFSLTGSPRAHDSWYDEQGRLCCEEGYITHGSLDYYYIYRDGSMAPAYCLYVDHYGDSQETYPVLIRYPEPLVPQPLPEGSPLTLAGEELESAIMMDIPGGGYGFSKDAAANLEGWFQLLGFQAGEPFYEYYDPDGILRLRLWYDEESGMGVGIRYRDDYGGRAGSRLRGFGFTTTSWAARVPEWEEYGSTWYRWEAPLESPPLPDWMDRETCGEREEYDREGRLIGRSGSADCSDQGYSEDMGIYSMGFFYDEKGRLVQRDLWRNSFFYGTTNPSARGYFDSQGRLVYEYGYITHGSTDTYYIYEGEEEKPSYALYLDDNLGADFPEFVRYR